MIFLGIDPGLKGSLSAINERGEIVLHTVMPTVGNEYDLAGIQSFLAELLAIDSECRAVIEKPIILVGKSSRKTTRSVYYFDGLIQAMLFCMKISFESVSAKKWQSTTIGNGNKDTKAASIQYVQRKYPGFSLLATERSRKPHDGIADALCMAEYARRQYVG